MREHKLGLKGVLVFEPRLVTLKVKVDYVAVNLSALRGKSAGRAPSLYYTVAFVLQLRKNHG